MNSPQNSQVNALLVIVSLLAVAGGLAIVLVTSPQSLQLSQLNLLPPRATEPASATATPTASGTPLPATASLVPSSTHGAPTGTATAVIVAASATAPGSATPSLTPTNSIIQLTTAALAPDVRGLAVVKNNANGQTVRIRDLPNGPKLVLAVAPGTRLEVLFGDVVVNGIEWVEVRLKSFRTGWIARSLITFTFERAPGTVTAGPPATDGFSPSATPSPTQAQPNNTAPAPGATATRTPTSVPSRTPTQPPPGSTNTHTPIPPPSSTASRTPTVTPGILPT
ncbi:MAG: hypothetical protein ABI847_11325, partial [Anaerolineales bacterium]